MDDLNTAANNNFILVFNDVGAEGKPARYFARGATLPGFSMPGAPVSYQGQDFALPSNSRDRDDLSCEFLVAQNLNNYKFFRRWAALGKRGTRGIDECFKDITLIFLDANKNEIDKSRYLCAFPTNISQLSLEHGVMDSTPMTFTVNFAFAEELWE